MKEPQDRSRRSVGARGGGTLVIFGSTGNLATTRIIPAIKTLRLKGSVGKRFLTIGVDRRAPGGEAPISGYRFLRGDLRSSGTLAALGRLLRDSAGRAGPPVTFYLATGPELFPVIARGLAEEGLRGRIMVEKPFGVDLDSARILEGALRSGFPSRGIFRVDHFLGKEGTDLIQRVRFRLPGLEKVWNRGHVDHVQILADEGSAVGARGTFYDSAGVIRDMVQNHILQLLCLVAMEPPVGPDPDGVARSKARVLRALRMPDPSDVVWGQYAGYNRADGVKRNTRTPTFVAMRVSVENARWTGVPFYLRTGKALARTATEVVVVFKEALPMPKVAPGVHFSLKICIDPRSRLVIGTGREERAEPRGRPGESLDEYARLLQDAFDGDQARFVDERFNLLAWGLVDPLIRAWEGVPLQKPAPYATKTWGPDAAGRLIAGDGRFWRDGHREPRQS